MKALLMVLWLVFSGALAYLGFIALMMVICTGFYYPIRLSFVRP